MATPTTPAVIEAFHLAFLNVLPRFVDPRWTVLKGGANLRYFFRSLRYSEDIDLDVTHVEEWQLREKVGRVLESKQLKLLLRTADLEVSDAGPAKQTPTTQRWKVGVVAADLGEVRTKVEFSHRSVDEGFVYEQLPEAVVRRYGLRAPMVQHYGLATALRHKVLALGGRNETQARDVFDLDHLLRRAGSEPWHLTSGQARKAVDRALELPYAAFEGQVLPFLEQDARELFEGREAWDRMVEFVAGRLEEAADAER